MNLKTLFLTASFVSTVAIAGAVASSAQAATMNVYTGYADSLRPSGFFPGPWLGDSGVVSQSAASQSGGFDSGAVRITNLTGSAFTVSNFQVKMNGVSGPTYAIWSSLVIGAGQDGIFTQTGAYNFDSSDNSFGSAPGGIVGSSPGSNGIGGCSSTAAAQAAASITALCAGRVPTVSFDIGLDHFDLSDSGHILDTGNYDFINGSTDGNESINWNLIGSGAIRGGTGGVPEPATWAMMLMGFGGIGAALRRRHRVALAH